MTNYLEQVLNEELLNDLNKIISTTTGETNVVDIPVVNMGVGSETSRQVVARSGADPYVIAEDFVIPGSTESGKSLFLFQMEPQPQPLNLVEMGWRQ